MGTRVSGFSFFGRSVGIRTRGLLDPNQARYQTSPHPVNFAIIMKFLPIVKPGVAFFHQHAKPVAA